MANSCSLQTEGVRQEPVAGAPGLAPHSLLSANQCSPHTLHTKTLSTLCTPLHKDLSAVCTFIVNALLEILTHAHKSRLI